MRTVPLIVPIAMFIALPLSMGAEILLVPMRVAARLASAAAILVHDSLLG